ncbi:unnamed protein product [Durusdinium trenchii]
MGRSVVFVGIAGASGCGKTTLARKLAEALQSPLEVLHLDNYFQPKGQGRPPKHYWETPDGVDFEALRKDLKKIRETFSHRKWPKKLRLGRNGKDLLRSEIPAGADWKAGLESPMVVLVEGFLLFYDDLLAEMLDLKIWINASCGTCMRRRHLRGWNSRHMDLGEYGEWFVRVVWRHFEWYQRKQLRNAKDALQVPGDASEEEVFHYSLWCLPFDWSWSTDPEGT